MANKKTKAQLKEFALELKALLEEHEMDLWVDIEGDTYGINVIGFMAVDRDDNQYCLHDGMLGLDKYDLQQFVKEL